MPDPVKSDQVYRFGVFVVSAEARELLRQGRAVKIQDQPFALLLLFLDHPGEILDRNFLREQLWPDNTFVDFADLEKDEPACLAGISFGWQADLRFS